MSYYSLIIILLAIFVAEISIAAVPAAKHYPFLHFRRIIFNWTIFYRTMYREGVLFLVGCSALLVAVSGQFLPQYIQPPPIAQPLTYHQPIAASSRLVGAPSQSLAHPAVIFSSTLLPVQYSIITNCILFNWIVRFSPFAAKVGPDISPKRRSALSRSVPGNDAAKYFIVTGITRLPNFRTLLNGIQIYFAITSFHLYNFDTSSWFQVVINAEQEAQLPAHLLNPFYKNPRVAEALAKESWFGPGEMLVNDRETQKIPRTRIFSVLKNAGLARRR